MIQVSRTNLRKRSKKLNATNAINSINLISDFRGVLFMLTRSKWRARLCVLLAFIFGATCRVLLSTKTIYPQTTNVRTLGYMGSTIYYYRRTALFMFFWISWTKTKGKKRPARSEQRRLPSTKFAPRFERTECVCAKGYFGWL